MTPYEVAYRRSLEDPEGFWAEAAEGIDWERRWDRVLDADRAPIYHWFRGGRLNTCYNAVDRHVAAGRGDQPALIYDSPMTGRVETYTYRQLQTEVARLAGAIRAQGVGAGDRVIVYMPIVPQAVFGMLACARIGAVHSVVFGGFAAHELAARIDHARPVLILSASCGLEPGRVVKYKPLLDEAIAMAAHKPARCIVLQRPEEPCGLIAGRDVDWNEALAAASPADCVTVAATDPLYILYTSGTTGRPKGVLRDNGGHAVALHYSMKAIYGIDAGETFWAASDIGWAVGHSYIVYAPLLKGCASVLYEGKPVGTPDPGAFWRVVSQHKVNALFTAPTAFRAIKRDDPQAKHLQRYDTSSMRTLFLAGERCDPDTLSWAGEKLGVPVVDHWWQTETGWPICATCVGLGPPDIVPGSAGRSVPGYDVRIFDNEAHEVPAGENGNVVIKLPMPPGCLEHLYQDEEGYRSVYLERFPGWYLTGDGGYKDASGHVFIMGRTDDVINVAGHRLSTGSIEEVLSAHPDVAECAVVGVNDSLKGELPVGFVVPKSGSNRPEDELVREVVELVRQRIGPVACFKSCAVVKRLPKTRSGKILRGTVKKIADGMAWKMPPTIDDPAILDEMTDILKRLGYAKP